MKLDLELALDVARRAVEAAGKAALPHYERGVSVELKPDESPVTAADRESEAAILATIRRFYPEHRVLAEESGAHEGDPENRWIVDPLDGTRGFSRGGSFWGPLVAFEHKGEIVAAAAGMPVLGHLFWAASGLGCFKNGARLRVSEINDWRRATLSVGELQNLLRPPLQAGMLELISTAASTRGYGDPAGFALVLEGRAEVWVEAGVKPWDLAASKILVEEAGGRWTSIDGSSSVETGSAVASNGILHDHVLNALRR